MKGLFRTKWFYDSKIAVDHTRDQQSLLFCNIKHNTCKGVSKQFTLWAATFILGRLISQRKAYVELGHRTSHSQACVRYKVINPHKIFVKWTRLFVVLNGLAFIFSKHGSSIKYVLTFVFSSYFAFLKLYFKIFTSLNFMIYIRQGTWNVLKLQFSN